MGKSPYFYANQKHYKTKIRANCVHAGLRILETSRLQTVQRTKPVRKDHKGHQGPPHVETTGNSLILPGLTDQALMVRTGPDFNINGVIYKEEA
jgi:hypothetical protein